MTLFIFLLANNTFKHMSEGEIGFTIFLGIIDLIVYIAPLIISHHVEKIYHQNQELKSELSEIKNLLIYQNDLIKNQQSPYNPYYQQQQYSQQYNQQQNNTFHQ